MYCNLCDNSRFLLFRDPMPNEDGFYRVECAKILKDVLWCKSYNKIVDAHIDVCCERASTIIDLDCE